MIWSVKDGRVSSSKPIRFVIRPGCYITHDHGIYDEAQNALKMRDSVACQLDGDLMPAMKSWH